ncbi:hypothetical protein ACFVMC_28270 [Nocardia sp. NPDC127579]|uniref:hypothetical protein n=1 Tax=Nocardia sp. NPDC127579 TaxID=3345402 RepID=UPI00363D3129
MLLNAVVSDGRFKTTRVIDVALLLTLARRSNVDERTGDYGFVVVDECHHIAASAFIGVLTQIPARYRRPDRRTPGSIGRRSDLDDADSRAAQHLQALGIRGQDGLHPFELTAEAIARTVRLVRRFASHTGDLQTGPPGIQVLPYSGRPFDADGVRNSSRVERT